MTSDVAAGWLSPLDPSFWRWADGGSVAVWAGGETLAFEPELAAVVRTLAPEGLPPLDALLLLLAACRPRWPNSDRSILWQLASRHEASLGRAELRRLIRDGTRNTRRSPAPGVEAVINADAHLHALLEVVLAGLDAVHALPSEVRTRPADKVLVAQAVFETCEQRLDRDCSVRIGSLISRGVGPQLVDRPASGTPKQAARRFVDSLLALLTGLSSVPHSREAMELRLRTGLHATPEAAPLEMPSCEVANALLRQLQDDPELTGLARLARDLMAVVCLPRRMHEQEDLPVGGFSDIANRGTLDRLLPGELAHDDLTLTVRIALQEAMYYRRENPPRNPVSRRRILLDTGIRCWGLPRVYGTAVALALMATATRGTSVEACRAEGDEAVAVDLTSRDGIVEVLEALTLDAHPGEALPRWLAPGADAADDADHVLITHDDVLTDQAFVRAAENLGSRVLFIAAINRSGGYRLERWSASGRAVLREAQLDLESILSPGGAAAVVDPDSDPSLPVIFGLRPLPLLLPDPGKDHACVVHKDLGLLRVSNDRRLMLWTQPGRGGLQLWDAVPRGRVIWMGLTPRQALAVVAWRTDALVVTASLDGTSAHVAASLPGGSFLGACLIGEDRLCLITQTQVQSLSLADSSPLRPLTVPRGLSWRRGRVFHGPSGWHILAATPEGVCLMPVRLDSWAGVDVLEVFEREGVDGLWAVLGTGEVACLDGDFARTPIVGQRLVHSPRVSPDGHTVIMQTEPAGQFRHVNLLTGQVQTRRDQRMPTPEAAYVMRDCGGLRRNLGKMAALAVDDQNRLCLTLTSGGYLRFCLREHGIRLERGDDHTKPRVIGGFAPVRRRGDVGYSLKAASAANGSRAWLDSRGLLHLRSHAPRVPELALALVSEGEIAGWASNGSFTGPEFFLGDQPPVRPEVFYGHIEAFTRNLG